MTSLESVPPTRDASRHGAAKSATIVLPNSAVVVCHIRTASVDANFEVNPAISLLGKSMHGKILEIKLDLNTWRFSVNMCCLSASYNIHGSVYCFYLELD